MTDRPIIFSGDMVRALVAGRQTQTHRLATSPLRHCIPGDRLWVKETSADVHPLAVQEGRFSIEGRAGIPGPPPVAYRRVYRADGDVCQVWHTDGHPYRSLSGPRDAISAKHPNVCSEWVGRLKYQPWESSRYMPRWASRLTLVVTEVRPQRLHDITEFDAEAEGVEPIVSARYGESSQYVEEFKKIWERLHSPNLWIDNPEVIALTFIVIQENIDALEDAAA